MGEGGDTTMAESREEATDVAGREAQEPRGVRGREAALLDLGKDMRTLLLRLGQSDRLPVHNPRVT